MPDVCFGSFDQDVSSKTALRFKSLYQIGREKMDMNLVTMSGWVAQAFLNSIMLFFLIYGTYNDHALFGVQVTIIGICLILFSFSSKPRLRLTDNHYQHCGQLELLQVEAALQWYQAEERSGLQGQHGNNSMGVEQKTGIYNCIEFDSCSIGAMSFTVKVEIMPSRNQK